MLLVLCDAWFGSCKVGKNTTLGEKNWTNITAMDMCALLCWLSWLSMGWLPWKCTTRERGGGYQQIQPTGMEMRDQILRAGKCRTRKCWTKVTSWVKFKNAKSSLSIIVYYLVLQCTDYFVIAVVSIYIHHLVLFNWRLSSIALDSNILLEYHTERKLDLIVKSLQWNVLHNPNLYTILCILQKS